MVITVVVFFILSSIVSFLLLAKFYPPLNRKLFGGEFEIPFDDIQFWVKKVPQRSYYRVYTKYLKSPETVVTWLGHPIFFADTRGTLGSDDIFFNPEDNNIYGGGSEREKGWEWDFFRLGEGRFEAKIFKPIFPEGTKFTFLIGGSLEITDAPAYYITIYLPTKLKKIEKEELKGALAEIIEDYVKRNKEEK